MKCILDMFNVIKCFLLYLSTPIINVCVIARHEHHVPWRLALWVENSRRKGAPRDETMGEARETGLTSGNILVSGQWRILTFNGRCHGIIVIKTDLSGFVVTIHSCLCEQYVQSFGLTASGFDLLFARTLLHYDKKHRIGLNLKNLTLNPNLKIPQTTTPCIFSLASHLVIDCCNVNGLMCLLH